MRDQDSSGEGLSPVEGLLGRDLDDDAGRGRAFSDRVRQSQRSVEAYLRGGGIPRWMERSGEIDAGVVRARRELERAQRELRLACGDDPAAFARRWTAVAEGWDFGEHNDLVDQHNEWYPVERDLPMDPRTRDYVLLNGRSYRREPLGPEWVLEQFPPVLPARRGR